MGGEAVGFSVLVYWKISVLVYWGNSVLKKY